MKLEPRALLLITVAAIGVILLEPLGGPIAPFRVGAGILLGLWMPGMALLLAVRPRFIADPASYVLAVPLSMSFLAVDGVIADHTSFGLRPFPLAVGVVLPTLLLLSVAELRSSGRPWRRAIRQESEGRQSHHVSLSGLVSRARLTLREPLFVHAYALGLSGVLTSGLGVVYWAVAARIYPPETVGVNAALLSLAILVGNVAQLNLRSGFGRFVPIAGVRVPAVIGWGYAAALAIATVGGLAIIGLLIAAPALLPGIVVTPLLMWLFPATAVLLTAFILQDHVLTAVRRTTVVPVENAIFGVAKIGTLVYFAGLLPDFGILASWTVPTAIGVLIVSSWLVRSLIPAHMAASRRSGTSQEVTLAAVARFVGVDYLASLFAIASTALLPSIVLRLSGAAISGHFYIVTLIASIVQLLPTVMSASLLVEVAGGHASFEREVRRVLRQLYLLLVPLVAVIVVFAPQILEIFGHAYAEEGTMALRLFALAGLPYALQQVVFVRLRIEGRVRVIVAAQAAQGVMLVVGSVVVLPSFGIAGIGAVLLVSQSVVAAVLLLTELWPVLRTRSRPAPPTPLASVEHSPPARSARRKSRNARKRPPSGQ